MLAVLQDLHIKKFSSGFGNINIVSYLRMCYGKNLNPISNPQLVGEKSDKKYCKKYENF